MWGLKPRVCQTGRPLRLSTRCITRCISSREMYEASFRFSNQIRTVIKAGSSQQTVCAASAAGAVAGRGGLGSQCPLVLPHQVFVGDAVIHMGPGGHLVQADGPVAVEMGIDAQVLKDLHPGV